MTPLTSQVSTTWRGEISPFQLGTLAGYAADPGGYVLPPCPYPLHDLGGGRNRDRTQWLTGWVAGRNLRTRHDIELRQLCTGSTLP